MKNGAWRLWLAAVVSIALWVALGQVLSPVGPARPAYDVGFAWTARGGFSRFVITPISRGHAGGVLWRRAVQVQVAPFLDCSFRASGRRSLAGHVEIFVAPLIPLARYVEFEPDVARGHKHGQPRTARRPS